MTANYDKIPLAVEGKPISAAAFNQIRELAGRELTGSTVASDGSAMRVADRPTNFSAFVYLIGPYFPERKRRCQNG